MALVFIEGFDHLGASVLDNKGWSGTTSLSMQAGRFGGQAVHGTNTSSTTYWHAAPFGGTTCTLGVAFVLDSAAASGDLASFTTNATLLARLGHVSPGRIRVLNNAGTTIATGTTALVGGTYYYAEMQIFFNGASGTCEVHLNGASGEIASTVGNFGSVTPNAVSFHAGGAASGEQNTYDDMYALDNTGTTNTTFLGDVRVATVFPNGAGAHQQFTPLSSTLTSNVDEVIADGDTTYNYDLTPNDIDTFTTPGVSASGSVYGVQNTIFARKDDAGLRSVAPLTRQAGTDYPGTGVALGPGYAFYSQLLDKDPAGANWTAANLNADEFGYKVTA